MERLVRMVLCLGTGMSVVLFGMLLFVALPGIIDNSARGWDDLQKDDPSESEILAMFEQHPAYVAMYERFPDAAQDVNFDMHGGAYMRVGAINLENHNQLVVNMYYERYSDSVNVHLNCMSESGEQFDNIEDIFAHDVIRTTDCLEL